MKQAKSPDGTPTKHRICFMAFGAVYPAYLTKATKKGRTKDELDQIIRWHTGHTQKSLEKEIARKTTFEDFFAHAPKLNPARNQVTGLICGVRVEEIEEPTMREIRILDKLVDELSRGRPMEKILRA
jgi:hypothetical protein